MSPDPDAARRRTPPPLGRHRNPGDAWVEDAEGNRYWGRFGAAGLLAHDRRKGVLLQHRAEWSHHGGTWGIPGGALHEHETALAGAFREAAEEAGVPDGAVAPAAMVVLDRAVWSYTTVLGRVVDEFEPEITDAESIALAWVPLDDVEGLPLHPGLAAGWPRLRSLLEAAPMLVVDGANVVGSVPDGWWRDRPGAAARLASRLSSLVTTGLPGDDVGVDADRVMPDVVLVVEGKARGITAPHGVTVEEARGEGDDTIVEIAARAARKRRAVTVVTADRGLRDRLPSGAVAVGPRWLHDRLSQVQA